MLRHARASDIGVDITSRMLLILILILIASMGIYSALLVYYTLSQYLYFIEYMLIPGMFMVESVRLA